jgi:hypothetical protein
MRDRGNKDYSYHSTIRPVGNLSYIKKGSNNKNGDKQSRVGEIDTNYHKQCLPAPFPMRNKFLHSPPFFLALGDKTKAS